PGRLGGLLHRFRLKNNRFAIFAAEHEEVDAGGRGDVGDRISAGREGICSGDRVFRQVHGDAVQGRGGGNPGGGAEQGGSGTRISEARNCVFHWALSSL